MTLEEILVLASLLVLVVLLAPELEGVTVATLVQ
jgi:hypothetical protein